MARVNLEAKVQTKALSVGEYAYGQSRLGLAEDAKTGSTQLKFSGKASDSLFRRAALKTMATVMAATVMASAIAPTVASAQNTPADTNVKTQIVQLVDQQVQQADLALFASTQAIQQDSQFKQAQDAFDAAWKNIADLTKEVEQSFGGVSPSDVNAMENLYAKMAELHSTVKTAEVASFKLDRAFRASQDDVQNQINSLANSDGSINKQDLAQTMFAHNGLAMNAEGIDQNLDQMVYLRMKYENVNTRLRDAINAQKSGNPEQIAQAAHWLKVSMNDTMTGVLSEDVDIAHALSTDSINEWQQEAVGSLPSDNAVVQNLGVPNNSLSIKRTAPAA